MLASGASAVGLGDVRGQPVLGEGLRLQIELLGQEVQRLDESCLQLVQPVGIGDQPWLKRASLTLRKGADPFLEIRTEVPVREPVVHLAVNLACGHEISRSYALLTTTHSDARASERPPVTPPATVTQSPARPPVARASRPGKVAAPVASAPVKPAANQAAGDVLDPLLRAASERLSRGEPLTDAQREALRIHLRTLTALQEQAAAQLATAEKLREMEKSFEALQQRSAEFAQRVEKEAQQVVPAQPPVQAPPSAPEVKPEPPATPVAAPVPVAPPVPQHAASGQDDWHMLGLVLGIALGLGGWLGWKRYRERPESRPLEELVPAARPKPVARIATPEPAPAPVVPVAEVAQRPAEVSPVAVQEEEVEPVVEHAPLEFNPQSVAPVASLDEQFEANPVMELADIMLSFGRVKGAAQALQEFIDHNPQEALQPWIRLMNVYRMAGMRDEFETVARNLNRHFNVEVQKWENGLVSIESPLDDAAAAGGPQSLEEMPRLMNRVVELWTSGDVVGYLYELLRDNRGGQRLGFALPVVEDILFLIELKETVNRME